MSHHITWHYITSFMWHYVTLCDKCDIMWHYVILWVMVMSYCVMLWHLKGPPGDLPVASAWGLHDLEGSFFETFFEDPFWRPKWGNVAPKWSQNDPKNGPKIDILGNTETSILAIIYYTLSTLAPPRFLPKLMRKSHSIKTDLKYFNMRKIVPKWVPKWSSFFPGFGQKWYQNLMWIPRWPQRTPGDPKMDPQDLTWPKNGPKMAQNGSTMDVKMDLTSPKRSI